MGGNLPIVLIEVVLIFGSVLAFAWWQLHEIKVDQRKAAAQRAESEAREALAARLRDEQSAPGPGATEAAGPADAPPAAGAS